MGYVVIYKCRYFYDFGQETWVDKFTKRCLGNLEQVTKFKGDRKYSILKLPKNIKNLVLERAE